MFFNFQSDDKSKDTKNAPLNKGRRNRHSSIETILFQDDDTKSRASSKDSDAIIFNSRWKLPGNVPKNDDVPDDHYDKRFSVKTLRTFSVIEPLTSPLYSHYRSCEDVRKLRRYSMPVEVHCHSPKQQASKSCVSFEILTSGYHMSDLTVEHFVTSSYFEERKDSNNNFNPMYCADSSKT